MSEATLERGMNAFREQMDAPIASFFSSCVNCGMCAEACLFYTETGDPRYTPINKLEPLRRVWEQEYTLWGKVKSVLGLSQPVTDELLEEWESLIYDGCTLCGRCSMVCPVGNDISYMIRHAREGFVAAGYSPEGMKGASRRAVTIGSPMGVKYPALAAQIKHVEADSGLQIPVDVEGVDYMALLSSMEIMNFPEYLEALARIFKQAGVTWTISSEAFEATNAGIQIGSSDIARELVNRVVVAAEKLKVKYVISPECGHAYTAIRWEGPNLIGRPYSFKVVHILELLDELRASGRLKTEGMDETRLTFHDPCQIVRKGGVLEPPRNLLKMVASEFVDMHDAREMNWCCGGGGGVSANERAEELRLKVFKRKKTQLDELNVETLVTACANCRLVIEEGLEEYRMEIPVVGLTEMLAEHLVEDKSE
ncbi:MAG: heterodisulfide reductase [gamma proteobacterium symbiont of Ctena orbiculata]|uniref:(Fe-S)-binding protein n=1 Tax=Candidatus Thiodiazotropha taylori TaxID=2792791 RepID=A0A944QVN2_9GAMM|nr:(Fe-S)-binding protein [Candidatus Thiodiazotropha taylori]PUB88657.1 MAG: heterodisulfide reductase [gamma proteobacterium symbiont of Ctena orbiculata]MBT3027370.1 (Fe-S)-binding protein [Candidatus Thiodiazotropha taylori]MBT3035167.1 (Fe-S)-binding protein [Candidatus Thiodiazotropha taylori]MBV2138497.1 (Fe-S)-binding protein [Candidatus Thiodiazotropha taylori]